MSTKILSLRSVKKTGVYFGCYGNPMKQVCNCCDSDKKNYNNYKQYLEREKEAKKLNYRKENYEHDKRFSIFYPRE